MAKLINFRGGGLLKKKKITYIDSYFFLPFSLFLAFFRRPKKFSKWGYESFLHHLTYRSRQNAVKRVFTLGKVYYEVYIICNIF